MPNTRPQTRAGYLVAEIAIGFALLAVLAVSVTVMVQRHNRAAEVLADRRQATRAAEQVLLSLQSQQIAQPTDDRLAVTVQPVDQPAAPAGRQWVRVDVHLNGQTATLLGLARISLLNREGLNP
jgi:type II secretory pathway pseudopilin PulG